MKCKGLMGNLLDYDLRQESALKRQLQIHKCIFCLNRYDSCTI